MTKVSELILALASYPLDAEIVISDPFVTLDVAVDADGDVPDCYTVYEPYVGVTPYERPDIIRQVVERNHPGDDHQTAVEFLEWLHEQGIRLANIGHGHNDGDSPVGDMQRIALAVSFAERPNA